ncbi:MAG: D-alanine--D-alanine ligase family protein [Pseudobdellovibrionaceae bacterium]|jgi:D-alanine-D-alanine ligase|nr:D-alanine--D-alanine ligase [Pseudomonadota bacterium]
MKKTVALIFGGKSAEHEISLLSCKNVASAVDTQVYNKFLVGISKQGTWFYFEHESVFEKIKALNDHELPAGAEPVALITRNGSPVFFFLNSKKEVAIDIAFPVLHGTYGEDGSIQGLFKMMNLPFVGCGVWGSAAGMDKAVMKKVLKDAGIPHARYKVLYSHKSYRYEDIAAELGSPFFIKPANAGSSVGVHKIKTATDFSSQLQDSFKFDHKVLAEEFIQGREIECSVMGLNHSPKASVAGEVIPTHEFYSYEAKYLDDQGAALKIPAELSAQELATIQKIARETFTAMGCDGLTRVDFFLKKDGQAYINEINTIPGFTKISMYPKMWEASGLGYKDLISQLIQLGFDRYALDKKLETNYF